MARLAADATRGSGLLGAGRGLVSLDCSACQPLRIVTGGAALARPADFLWPTDGAAIAGDQQFRLLVPRAEESAVWED